MSRGVCPWACCSVGGIAIGGGGGHWVLLTAVTDVLSVSAVLVYVAKAYTRAAVRTHAAFRLLQRTHEVC